MSWSQWQVDGIMGGFKAVGSFITQRRQAKADEAWQKYNNAMTRLQGAMNENNINVNQNMAVERQVRESYNLRMAKYQTESKAEVASAALGAEGNSVDMVMRDINMNEARMQEQMRTDMNYQMVGFDNQRKASAMQTAMQIDYTQIPKPSLAQSLLNWGAETATGWWESKKLNK